MLIGGGNCAWGDTVWKTYKTWDFITSFAASDVSGLLPAGSWTTSGSGAATIAKVTTTIASATAVTTSTSNRYYGIKLHADADKMQLASDGICLLGTASYVTIPNLKTGQRVTVTIDNSNGVEVYSGSVATLSSVSTTTSGNYYKTVGIVGTGGDLTIKRHGGTTFRIRSVLVETPIVDAVYTQEFTGVTEKPADWTVNAGTITYNNNMTITHPSSGTNSRNGFMNISSSVSSLTGNNWTITFKAAMTPGNNQSAQEIAVWGSNSSYTSNSKSYKVSKNSVIGSRINDNNAFFQAYNTSTAGTTYTVLLGGVSKGTVELASGIDYIYTVHCTDINTSTNTANLEIIIIKADTGIEVYNNTQSISTTTTGTLGGIFYLNARYSSVTTFDDIYLTQSDFALGETSKTIDIADNGVVSVTGVSGNISVASGNASIATASYSDGNVTINGVAKGNTTITVNCNNNGVTTTKTIDVTVRGYDELYAEEKAPYDSKVENLDATGQAYWTANVTDPATVTTSEAYATAVAALPTTYIAAVKAQGAGSDMTDAMPEGNAGWTCDQGNGPASYLTTGATETYSDGTNNPKFVAGNIMSQTISDLQNGYYSVQFYGVVNAANSVSMVSGSDLVQAYANATDLDIDVVLQDACTPTDYLRTIEAQVTDGTLTYGLKAKEGVEDAGNWAVAKIFKLTYLGTEKKTYTINAVAGETTIKELATGSVWASEDYGTYIPKVILYNSKYYVLDDGENANLSGYYASYTMGATNETKEINYTLDESIVAYTEGEGSSYRNVTASNNPAYSCGDYVNASNNNGNLKRNRGFDLGTLPKGMYQMVAYVINTTKSRSVALRNIESETTASEPIILITNSGKITGELTANFLLTELTKLRVNGANNPDNSERVMQMEEIDYVLIRKIGEVLTSSANLQGYKTFYDENNNYQVDANTTIYKAAATVGSVTLTSVEGNIIPKETPVILRTSNTTDYTMTLTATTSEPTDGAYDGNALQVAEGTESNKYILAYTTDYGFGFYEYTGTLDAGDIYLDIPGGGGAKMLRVVVDGTATEVTAPEVVETEEPEILYNMAGQIVGKDYKGIVINQKGEKRFNK